MILHRLGMERLREKYPQIDLTLQGHTHGFQFGAEIPALKIKWSPVQYVYKRVGDL